MIPLILTETDAGRVQVLGAESCFRSRGEAISDALMASQEPLRSIGFYILRELQAAHCINRPVRRKR